MKDMARLLEKWQLNVGDVREQMYRAPTPRERERWHGLWLLVQGWSVTQVAEALERDSHTIGDSVLGMDDPPYRALLTGDIYRLWRISVNRMVNSQWPVSRSPFNTT